MRNICAPSTIAYVTPAWTPCITPPTLISSWLLGGGLWLLTANVCPSCSQLKLLCIQQEPATHCAKLPPARMRQAALTSALRRLHCAQVHRRHFSKACPHTSRLLLFSKLTWQARGQAWQHAAWRHAAGAAEEPDSSAPEPATAAAADGAQAGEPRPATADGAADGTSQCVSCRNMQCSGGRPPPSCCAAHCAELYRPRVRRSRMASRSSAAFCGRTPSSGEAHRELHTPSRGTAVRKAEGASLAPGPCLCWRRVVHSHSSHREVSTAICRHCT